MRYFFYALELAAFIALLAVGTTGHRSWLLYFAFLAVLAAMFLTLKSFEKQPESARGHTEPPSRLDVLDGRGYER